MERPLILTILLTKLFVTFFFHAWCYIAVKAKVNIKSGYTVIAKLLPLNTDILLNTNLKIHGIQVLSQFSILNSDY